MRRGYYRFASTQALQTAICLPLGSGSASVQSSTESIRVALIHTALPLCGSAWQFAFEQVQLSIGMLLKPFPNYVTQIRADPTKDQFKLVVGGDKREQWNPNIRQPKKSTGRRPRSKPSNEGLVCEAVIASHTSGSRVVAETADPQSAAREAGLRYFDDRHPGITRQKRGKHFAYFHPDGKPVT